MVAHATRNKAKYVVQRASESRCEWWTDAGWSEDKTDALRYADKPNAGDETGKESTTAQVVES